MMATHTTASTDGTQQRHGTWTRRAIVAAVVTIVGVSVVGSTSVADVLARLMALGSGVGIVVMCGVGWYLIGLAALDGASRQFGHAWRNRRV